MMNGSVGSRVVSFSFENISCNLISEAISREGCRMIVIFYPTTAEEVRRVRVLLSIKVATEIALCSN